MTVEMTVPISSCFQIYIHHDLMKLLLLITLVVLIFKYKFRLPNALVQGMQTLPCLKLGFLYPFGHVVMILPQRKRKTVVPCHVYDFMAFMGYNKLFDKFGISSLWQFQTPIVNVFQADLVEVVLSNSVELKKSWIYKFLHPWLGNGLLLSYDEKWRRRRKLLTTAFHFNILKDFQPIFQKKADILLGILKKHTSHEYVDIVPLFSRCSLDIICESVFGSEAHSQTLSSSPYAKSVLKLSNLVAERQMRPWQWNEYLYLLFPSGQSFFKNKRIIHDSTNNMINRRKKEMLLRKPNASYGQRNLMNILLSEHIDKGSITGSEIREEVDTFTFGGHDTTSIAMSWALYLIGLHPWVQEKIHDELDSIFGEEDREATMEDLKNMKYTECVFKESMRLYPSVPVIGRELRNDLDLDGYKIPAGSMCMVNIYLLHRDAKFFPNPEKFDPDRFLFENNYGKHPFAYIPFSAGPRNCIGQRFALLEEKTVISSILRKYKVKSLDPRDRVHEMNELTLKPVNGLRIQIRRRNCEFDFQKTYYRP